MRSLSIMAILAVASALSACSIVRGFETNHDEWGNEYAPSIPVKPVWSALQEHHFATRQDVKMWCLRYNGVRSGDGYACAVARNSLTGAGDFCAGAFTDGLPAEQEDSDKRFAAQVCNGWVPSRAIRRDA